MTKKLHLNTKVQHLIVLYELSHKIWVVQIQDRYGWYRYKIWVVQIQDMGGTDTRYGWYRYKIWVVQIQSYLGYLTFFQETDGVG